MSDEKQGEELHVRAVIRALHHLVVLERELTKQAKLSMFKSIFVPILT